MARYEHLPIYKQAMDVAVHFEKVVAGFSRYCDDFVLFSHDRAQLLAWQEKIEGYLGEELKLALNPRQRLAPGAGTVSLLPLAFSSGRAVFPGRAVYGVL